MRAAVIHTAGQPPVYGDFREPQAGSGEVVLEVLAAALSSFSRSRSSGTHYSSAGAFPAVAGAEGVGRDAEGRRFYFVLPETPFGALAERVLVNAARCVPVPDGLDDVQAAALVNPGMSAWAALKERARLQAGETVLVNGATGTAGRLAVRLARFLGAGRVIVSGRNRAALEALEDGGADAVCAFEEGAEAGGAAYGEALAQAFGQGIDVVVDYLWGQSALGIIGTVARTVEDGHPVRFVQVGEAGGDARVSLPGAALRSSAIALMGSGVKSVPFSRLLDAVAQVYAAAGPLGLRVDVRTAALSEVGATWEVSGTPRLVYLPQVVTVST